MIQLYLRAICNELHQQIVDRADTRRAIRKLSWIFFRIRNHVLRIIDAYLGRHRKDIVCDAEQHDIFHILPEIERKIGINPRVNGGGNRC